MNYDNRYMYIINMLTFMPIVLTFGLLHSKVNLWRTKFNIYKYGLFLIEHEMRLKECTSCDVNRQIHFISLQGTLYLLASFSNENK